MARIECHAADEMDGGTLLPSHRTGLPYYLNRKSFDYGSVHLHPVKNGEIDHSTHIRLPNATCPTESNTAFHIRRRVRKLHRTRRGHQNPIRLENILLIQEFNQDQE